MHHARRLRDVARGAPRIRTLTLEALYEVTFCGLALCPVREMGPAEPAGSCIRRGVAVRRMKAADRAFICTEVLTARLEVIYGVNRRLKQSTAEMEAQRVLSGALESLHAQGGAHAALNDARKLLQATASDDSALEALLRCARDTRWRARCCRCGGLTAPRAAALQPTPRDAHPPHPQTPPPRQ